MRQFTTFLAAAWLAVSSLAAQVFTASNLPILKIETAGQIILNGVKTDANMQLIDKGPGQINQINDPANAYNGHIGIEIRGATSSSYPKQPYNIETRDAAGEDLEVSLLGMPKESDWALISPLNDKTLFRDVLAYHLAGAAMTWAPRTRFCEVVINGSYQGVYVLLEKIKRDKGRVDIAKLKDTDTAGDSLTGGYILAMDKWNGGGIGGDWVSPYPPIENGFQQTWFQIVYPKPDDIVPEQRAYIEDYVTDFEKAMYDWQPNAPGTPVYEQWIDTDSWVNFLLVNEISKNVDGYRLSSYFYKDRDDRDPLLHMGPVWDFNIAFGIGDYCEGQPTSGWMKDFNIYCGQDGWVIHFWWPKICRDSFFQQRVTARWQALRNGPWSDARLNFCIDSLAGLLTEAQGRNFQRWPVLGQYVWPNAFIGQTWQQEVEYLRDWVIERAHWMDANISSVGPSAVPPYPFLSAARVYPNPVLSGEKVMLEYSTNGQSEATFSLFDASGRLVLAPQRLPNGQRVKHPIRLSGLPEGVYFYRIQLPWQVLKVGKLEIGR